MLSYEERDETMGLPKLFRTKFIFILIEIHVADGLILLILVFF